MQPTHQNLLVTNLKEDNSCNFHSPSMHHHPDSNWTPSSWKSKPASQQAEYSNLEAYTEELNKLRLLPPIIASKEVHHLKDSLVDVYNGKGFILQIGDCAEKFADCNTETIQHKVLFYDLLGNLFTKITQTPAVVIGRMAGQFAKPRTELYEVVDGNRVMSFKGENINGFHVDDRTPDPKRMTEGYFKSAAIMNYIRQMKGVDVSCSHFNEKITNLNSEINNSQEKSLLETFPVKDKIKVKREIFVSHEALHLDYEDTQVREERNKHYDLSSHFLWIGMRTNMTGGAHVEFFRGLENPIGVKLQKEVANSPEDLKRLIEMIKLLNPKNEIGKLVLIVRFGARYVEDTLPKVLKAVLKEDLKVLWVVDGVHGNTQKVGSVKTRKLEDVREEILKTIKVFKEMETRLHGIHLELTPDEVTECLVGSFFEVTENDLERCYTSYCDPRLNFSQSIELISDVAHELKK